MSIARATTWEDRMNDLGNVPASRVRCDPAPGTATVEDVTRLRDTERRLYELVEPSRYSDHHRMQLFLRKDKCWTVEAYCPAGK
ncbi:MAG: hypothetical protein ABL921_16155 [Pirellula sp.]